MPEVLQLNHASIGLAWNGTVDGRKDAKQLMEEFTDALYNVGPLSIVIDATLHDLLLLGWSLRQHQMRIWCGRSGSYCTSRLRHLKMESVYNCQK